MNDGYISGTGYFKRAHKRRPQDMKRKILNFCVINELKELRNLEQKWLNLIKDEELNVKYYNMKKSAIGFDSRTAGFYGKIYGHKVGKSNKGKKFSKEHCEKLSKLRKGKPSTTLGKTWSRSAESKEKNRRALIGKLHTEERKRNISEALKRKYALGYKQTAEHKQKNREAQIGNKRALGVIKGTKWHNNGIINKRFHANNIPSGWILGRIKKVTF